MNAIGMVHAMLKCLDRYIKTNKGLLIRKRKGKKKEARTHSFHCLIHSVEDDDESMSEEDDVAYTESELTIDRLEFVLSTVVEIV